MDNGISLNELERQAEVERAELARTMDALHTRLSPAAVKARARQYARAKSRSAIEGIESQFRSNPLQTAAAAAGLAYPVWSMISRIPAPLLLIGAGVVLSHRRPPVPQEFGGTVQDIADRTGELKDAVAKSASDAAQMAMGTMREATSAVENAASATTSRAGELLSNAVESGKRVASSAVNDAEARYVQARDSVTDIFDRNPLLAGGIALAIGGVIASALPVTRRENQLMGEARDALKEQAGKAAKDNLDSAWQQAEEAYTATAEDVKQAGLTPETARRAVRNVAKTMHEAASSDKPSGDDEQPHHLKNIKPGRTL